jgi:glyoxylase-like metal-dependent hydrolase (beta-lactamase superfamily II)
LQSKQQMKIIPLSEGAFTVDKTKQFIPFNLTTDNLQQRPVGSLLVEIQPFAIITSKDIIVIDTGLGFTNNNGRMQIHQNLSDDGIDPLDVTKVLISHLHKDHAGGITQEDKTTKQRTLSFPNATYYINKDELAVASQKDNPSYHPEDFNILQNTPQAVKLTETSGSVDGYIHYEVTGAHSPYHQVFKIKENNQTIFFGGDVAPQLQQMKSRFIAKYDYDGKRSMELRQQWWQQGQQEGWQFLFYHDIKTPVFKFNN